MKIAVTAASGALGEATLKSLISQIGIENAIGIARNPERIKEWVFNKREGNYNSRSQFLEALKGIDTVILITSNDKPENRLKQHINVIDAAKQAGVSRIIFTGIIGKINGSFFDPFKQSALDTEDYLKNTGISYVVARNGLYIDPDLEAIKDYIADGCITNSAGEGKVSYTSRDELAYAYTKIACDPTIKNITVNLAGEAITQNELAAKINQVYNTTLNYKPVTVESYLQDRINAFKDEYFAKIIAGIYDDISRGHFEVSSDFKKVTGRDHKSILDIIKEHKENTGE